jgi:hypothetical protein
VGEERPETVKDPSSTSSKCIIIQSWLYFGYLAPEWLRVNETKPLVLGPKIIIIIIIKIKIISKNKNKNKKSSACWSLH